MTLTFHLIPHTHWDREWYLPRAGFQARLIPAIESMLDMLEGDPATRFVLDGQTVIADDVVAVHPEWIPRIARAAASGQLDLGPWYILADEIVPSGESLIRNLLQGARDSALLGRRMDVLYSPDAFGRPAILPTLAREFGIAHAVAWRGLGRPEGRDRDHYRWRGPDGGEVLLYHFPAQGYEIGGELAGDPAGMLSRWQAIRATLVARAQTSHVAVFVGADHHAPPRDSLAMRDAIQAIESGNSVRVSTLSEYFAAAAADASNTARLDGELRWSYGHTWTLQGTHATRARMKRRHGAGELYLQRQVEPLVALAGLHGVRSRHGLLRATWRTLLECQFHDTICGCCSDDVAREQETRLTSVAAAGREIAHAALDSLAGHDGDAARDIPGMTTPVLWLWNPAARSRGGVVTAAITCFRKDILVGPPSGAAARTGPGYRPFVLRTPGTADIPVQVLGVERGSERIDSARHYPDQDAVDVVHVAFVAPSMHGLALQPLQLRPGATVPGDAGVSVTTRRIANAMVAVTLDDLGQVELQDARTGERYANLLRIEAAHDSGDSYTPQVTGAVATMHAVGDAMIVADGPFVAMVRTSLIVETARGTIAARMTLMLHADSPVLRVRLDVDNGATDHRLRLVVPVGAGDAATAGAAFGWERRPPVEVEPAQYPAEVPLRTAPAHRYVAAGEPGRGLAVFCPGFFEYEWNGRRELAITLIRAIGELSKGDLSMRPGHAGWPMPTPDAQEPGAHRIDLAIAPMTFRDGTDIMALEAAWEDTFLPLQPRFIRNATSSVARPTGLALSGDSLVFTAIKPAESGRGVVVRCYNVDASEQLGRWTAEFTIAHATLVRADETPIAELAVIDSRSVEFMVPPRGIVSILLQGSAPA